MRVLLCGCLLATGCFGQAPPVSSSAASSDTSGGASTSTATSDDTATSGTSSGSETSTSDAPGGSETSTTGGRCPSGLLDDDFKEDPLAASSGWTVHEGPSDNSGLVEHDAVTELLRTVLPSKLTQTEFRYAQLWSAPLELCAAPTVERLELTTEIRVDSGCDTTSGHRIAALALLDAKALVAVQVRSDGAAGQNLVLRCYRWDEAATDIDVPQALGNDMMLMEIAYGTAVFDASAVVEVALEVAVALPDELALRLRLDGDSVAFEQDGSAASDVALCRLDEGVTSSLYEPQIQLGQQANADDACTVNYLSVALDAVDEP